MAEADWNSMVKPPADETYETYDKESYDAKLYEWRRLAKDQQAETIGLRASLLLKQAFASCWLLSPSSSDHVFNL